MRTTASLHCKEKIENSCVSPAAVPESWFRMFFHSHVSSVFEPALFSRRLFQAQVPKVRNRKARLRIMSDQVSIAASSDGAETAVTTQQWESQNAQASSEASGVAPLNTPETKVDGKPEPSTCSTCKKQVNDENSVVLMRSTQKQPLARRCKSCHSLKSRINRVISKHGSLAQDWTNVTEEQKKEFYKNFQNAAGEDLLARMQETIVESKRLSTKVEFEGSGEYFDETDMNERYKNKPEQLQNIFANTRRFFCAVRQVWLYEDVIYKRTATDTEEVSRVDKRKVQKIPKNQGGGDDGNDGSLANKKSKKNKSGTGDEELPKLKAGEKKKIIKKIELLTTKRLHVMDLCAKAKAEKVKTLVPAYVLEAAEKLIDEALLFSSKVEEALGKEHGNVKEILETADKHCEVLTDGASRVKCQVEQAMAFVAEQGSA